MATKSLFDTNPYLHDRKLYKQLLVLNVTSSTAIELVKLPSDLLRAIKSSAAAQGRSTSARSPR